MYVYVVMDIPKIWTLTLLFIAWGFRAHINRSLISFISIMPERAAIYFFLSYGRISSCKLLQLKFLLAFLRSAGNIAFSWESQWSELIYIQEKWRFNYTITFKRIIMLSMLSALLSELISDHSFLVWSLVSGLCLPKVSGEYPLCFMWFS